MGPIPHAFHRGPHDSRSPDAARSRAQDLGSSRVSLLMNRAEPGAAVPLHMHQVEETVVVFEGRIWVQLGEDPRVIGPNDTVIRPPLTPHAWGTEGSETARMIWVYGGPDPF